MATQEATTIKPYYDKDGITIYCGDCLEILPTLGKVDLLLTDPPYGIGAAKRPTFATDRMKTGKVYKVGDWDNKPPSVETLNLARGRADTSILWGGNYYSEMPASPCWLVWDKDNSGNFADCELAWTNLKKAVRKFRYRWNGMLQEHGGDRKEQRFHPTQKPVARMRWCLSLVPNAQTILDPFMGSGTTLVAAKLEGRKAIGIELEERYCEIAANRLSQGVLF